MAFKTLQNTTVQADVQSADILAVARGTGSLSNVAVSALLTFLKTAGGLGSYFLQAANNLSDLANAATARTNLGLGTAATQASTAFAASTAASITGGATITGGLTLSGGAVFTGATAQNVNPVAAAAIDWSVAEFPTKSISANTTFTFSGIAASKAQAIVLLLTITSAAVPTWPVAVKWTGGVAPTLANGTHMLGFVTHDGGTTVIGTVAALNVS